MRRAAAVLLALAPLAVVASDAPHDMSQTVGSQPITCDSCHLIHNALGVTLTTTAGNAAVCASCHTTGNFGFPYNTADQATPGGGGLHHRWDAAASGAAPGASDAGAQAPGNTGMLARINGNGGNLNCSTCHDQHRGASLYGPGTPGSGMPRATQHVSAVTKTPTSSAGTVTVSTVDAAASPRGYLVKISPDTTHFILSNDGGTSWWCWSGTGWTTSGCTGTPVTGPGRSTGAGVALNDPAGNAYVQVTFGGTPALGDTFGFYVSYPFPRMDNNLSAMCENCHVARVMNAVAASTGADGVKQFSHPVGDSLLSGRTYDRAGGTAPHGSILDASGAAQTAGDGNVTNDVRLATDGTVRCMSCHYPHATDSNSLSVHPR
jgi:predicted CXXCH cytochrome family protein